MRDKRKGLSEQPWYVRYNAYGIAAALLFFALTIYGATRDFEPFTLYKWTGIPNEVCPLTQFNTGYESKVEPGFYSVGHLEGSALLLNRSNEVIQSWELQTLDLEPYPREENPSKTVRSAPLEPGMYHFGLDGKVTGRMFFIIPTYQKVNKVGHQTFTVLPLENKRCKDFDYVEGG